MNREHVERILKTVILRVKPEESRRFLLIPAGSFSASWRIRMTKGITLVEIILSIAILGVFSTFAVVNFRSNKQNDLLRVAPFRAADALRAAQSYALAGVPESADAAVATAQMFGVYIQKKGSENNIGEAVIFADTYTASDGAAGVYDAGKDTEIKTISLDPDGRKTVILEDIKINTGGGASAVSIAFKKPDAAGFIDGKSGDTGPKEVVLTFKHAQSGQTKTITINRITGRVDAQF